jgi:hypothetical protein
MLKSPFDDLPPPGPKRFRKEIRANLRIALKSLVNFSDSVRAGKPPEWPPKGAYEVFMTQLNHFRLLSKRAPNARPIQLIREINSLWRSLGLIKALEGSVKALSDYLGLSLRSGAHATNAFASRTASQERLIELLTDSKSTLRQNDLDLMLDFLPREFHILKERASAKRIRPALRAEYTALEALNKAIAGCARLYLVAEHREAY